MIGRFLAICGWLAAQVRRPFGGPLRGLRRWAPLVVAALLALLAAAPIVVPMLDPQPQEVTVAEIAGGAVTEPAGWVRLLGEVVPLSGSPTGEPGRYGLFVDDSDTLAAIVVRSNRRISHLEPPVAVTGHQEPATVQVTDEEIPLEATVFGAPPEVVPTWIVELDAAAKPERATWWALSILPILLSVALVIGFLAGYPVFRPTSEVDAISAPLATGERVPAAFGGRLGTTVRDLGDPGGVLLVVRPGPSGDVLTAQPLSDDDRPAPSPAPIRSETASGRIGWVYTASEAVPALVVRAEGVNATLLFAKTGERDRVAALMHTDRR